MSEFLHMGKYAQYVWPAYGIVLVCFLLNIYWARRALAQARAEARRRLAIQKENE
ncbi:MAG TPA: heme exporter protein CcmD [Steroidobacteraceae bacterium]|nr:heme exporter protein CcmD [Steroidobacteraceae bacterium]